MKRYVLAVLVGLCLAVIVWAGDMSLSGDSAYVYVIGATSRTTGTIVLGPSEERNAAYGYIVCGPIIDADADADVGALLADTVIMVLKSNYNGLRYTLDSMRQVIAGTAKCSLAVNNSIDSLFLSGLELDYVVADTDNFAAGDSIKTSFSWSLKLKKR